MEEKIKELKQYLTNIANAIRNNLPWMVNDKIKLNEMSQHIEAIYNQGLLDSSGIVQNVGMYSLGSTGNSEIYIDKYYAKKVYIVSSNQTSMRSIDLITGESNYTSDENEINNALSPAARGEEKDIGEWFDIQNNIRVCIKDDSDIRYSKNNVEYKLDYLIPQGPSDSSLEKILLYDNEYIVIQYRIFNQEITMSIDSLILRIK